MEQLVDQRPAKDLNLRRAELPVFCRNELGYGEASIVPSVDCIMLLTPPIVHVRQLEHLAGSNKIIFVEKPLATRASDIPRIRAVISRNPRIYCSDHYADVRAMPLFSWLFRDRCSPLAAQLRFSEGDMELWQEGPVSFGRLERVEATLMEKSGFEGRRWLQDINQGGVVLDLVYHLFTILAYIFDQTFSIEAATLKTRGAEGQLLSWIPQHGAESYAKTTGHIGNIPFSCEVGKNCSEEARSFILHYSRGEAKMLFGDPNTLLLKTNESKCAVFLEGPDYDYVVWRFVDYLLSKPTEPHGLSAAVRAIEASDRVKQFANGSDHH